MVKEKFHKVPPEMAQNIASTVLSFYEMATEQIIENTKIANPTPTEKIEEVIASNLIVSLEAIVKTAGANSKPLDYTMQELLKM